MFRRTLIAALLATSPALAQPVAVPDCTVDGVLSDREGLKLDVTYRCRASQPLSFQPTEDRAAQYVSDLKVEQRDSVAEAHYRFDLSGFARAVDSTSVAVLRGNSVLATLGGWLLEPRGYDRVPVIDIRMTTGSETGKFLQGRIPTSLDGMSPRNPALLAMADVQVKPPIKAHSIIAVQGDGDYHKGRDGLVTYQSAHVDYVESEFIVRSFHTCLDNPATIEEVRRILHQHLKELPPATAQTARVGSNNKQPEAQKGEP